ncbi:histamine H2 receptor-like [Orbicella faveolata]|uniref:histamine H2 receptor-like n=1 Tax=Orbicella faveolata TaxID=48498 RepID=UPI0009E2901F|nr:histamine H2 receptor-like [Orbicella faveolata]
MDSLPSNACLLQNVTIDSSTNLSSSDKIERAFKTLFLVLIAVANITGNSSICLVVLKDRHLRVTVRNYAVASLALVDLLSVQIMIFQVLTYFNIGKEAFMCSLMGRIFGCLLYISILHLFTLSLDRYVAIFYPLRYRFMVTPRRAAVVLLTIWIVPIFSILFLPAIKLDLHGYASFYGCMDESLIEITDKKNHIHMGLNVTFLFFLPLLVMMWAYCRISKVAWYQANRVGVAVISAVRLPLGGRLPRARDRKWAKTLAIVIGAFLGCYLPIVVASLVHIYSEETSFRSLGKVLEILLFLTFLNTVLNPMIYSLRSNDYRKAFKRIFGTHTQESNSDRRLRLNYATQELESLTVSSLVTSSHANTS